jgi:hypothetical protein
MGRTWLSVSLGKTGIRIGRSFSDSELCGHLPSYRRYELRKGLQGAAEARGEPMNREDADYMIDKALATGGLDSAGDLAFPVKGTREEIVEQIIGAARTWGMPMTREQAEDTADAAIAAIGKRQFWTIIATAIAAAAIFVLFRIVL